MAVRMKILHSASAIALAVVLADVSWNRDLDRISIESLRAAQQGLSNLIEGDVRTLGATLEALLVDEAARALTTGLALLGGILATLGLLLAIFAGARTQARRG